MEVADLVVIGLFAGVMAGMFGVGGGALFVPALVLFGGLTQVEAGATSLLAIIPVALVGTMRQHSYGNVRIRHGLLLGSLAVAGTAAGVVLSNYVPEQLLRILFGGFLLITAFQLVRRGFADRKAAESDDEDEDD